jgi:Mg2+-importing ATPase
MGRFDFVRRRLSVVIQQGGRPILVCKGAAEEIVDCCTWIEDGDVLRPMDEG